GRRTRSGEGLGQAQSLAVDTQVGGQTHASVRPRRFRIPHIEEVKIIRANSSRKDQLKRWIALYLFGHRRIQQVGDINLATLEHRQACRRLRHTLVDQALHRGHLAPVALECLHDQIDPGRATYEHVGSEANWFLLEALWPHGLHVLFAYDPASSRRERAVEYHEVRPWLVQNKAHSIGIDDDHLLDLFMQELALGALEAEFNVLGGEWVAIVEFEPLAKLELVSCLVGAERPRFGET